MAGPVVAFFLVLLGISVWKGLEWGVGKLSKPHGYAVVAATREAELGRCMCPRTRNRASPGGCHGEDVLHATACSMCPSVTGRASPFSNWIYEIASLFPRVFLKGSSGDTDRGSASDALVVRRCERAAHVERGFTARPRRRLAGLPCR